MNGLVGTTAAAKQAGLTYRQVDYWMRRHAVLPTIRGEGSGSRTYWTPLQVDHLRVMAQIRKHCDLLLQIDGSGGIWTERLRGLWDALEEGRSWGFGIFVHADGTLDLVSPTSLAVAS